LEAIMNKQPMSLEQRIAAALQSDAAVTSTDVAALIEEAEAGIAKADRESAVDQTLSLDPKAARQAMADAAFAANRLRTLLSKLQVRYQQVADQERATAWLAEHDALERERDALAQEMAEVYPRAVAQIEDIFVRTNANDEALSELHQARPAGVRQHLGSAELRARGLDSFSRDTPSLRTSGALVRFGQWPPSLATAAAVVAIGLHGNHGAS
jgi:hypothetical protein